MDYVPEGQETMSVQLKYSTSALRIRYMLSSKTKSVLSKSLKIFSVFMLLAHTERTVAQGEPPPKPKPTVTTVIPSPATSKQFATLPATIVVRADQACKLTLDGDSKGTMQASQAKKIDVKLGEHLIEAVTLNGSYHWEKTVVIKETGQIIVKIELLEVKKAADTEAAIRTAAQERIRQEEAARILEKERAEKAAIIQQQEQAERRRLAEEEARKPTWIDPKTGLMWSRQDNGTNVDWYHARDFCLGANWGGFVNWRLPTAEELQVIYEKIQPNDWNWSSSVIADRNSAFVVRFSHGESTLYPFQNLARALCVRNP
jgi:Protein of unknown function (DUF1566)